MIDSRQKVVDFEHKHQKLTLEVSIITLVIDADHTCKWKIYLIEPVILTHQCACVYFQWMPLDLVILHNLRIYRIARPP